MEGALLGPLYERCHMGGGGEGEGTAFSTKFSQIIYTA